MSVPAALERALQGTDPSGPVGSIYCAQMPGSDCIFKIGKTSGNSRRRVAALNTSTIEDFRLRWSLLVRDYHAVEAAIHAAMHPFRISDRREFFEFDPRAVRPLRDYIEELVGVDTRRYANAIPCFRVEPRRPRTAQNKG